MLSRRDAEIAEFSKGLLRVLCDSAVILLKGSNLKCLLFSR
jgi:hypothetical protein